MNEFIIAIGSNIEVKKNIPKVKEKLNQYFSDVVFSDFLETEPLGFADQANFINACAKVLCENDLNEVNIQLKEIEKTMGRVKTANKNGPRIIDLDIIVFNHNIIDDDFYERDFLKKLTLQLLPDLSY